MNFPLTNDHWLFPPIRDIGQPKGHWRLVGRYDDDEKLRQIVEELQQVLPGLSRNQVQGLLRALRDEGRIRVEGQRRWARWLHALAKRGNESEIAKRSKPDA